MFSRDFFENNSSLISSFLIGSIIGCLFGYGITYLVMVKPLKYDVDSSKRINEEWEKLVNIERQRVLDLKNVTEKTAIKYLSQIDEMNTKFAELQGAIHEAEAEMGWTNWVYVLFAVIIVFLAILLTMAILNGIDNRIKTTFDSIRSANTKNEMIEIIATYENDTRTLESPEVPPDTFIEGPGPI